MIEFKVGDKVRANELYLNRFPEDQGKWENCTVTGHDEYYTVVVNHYGVQGYFRPAELTPIS